MTPASNSTARKREQERHASQPAPEVGLTEGERLDLGERVCWHCYHRNPWEVAARIKADAIQQERAAWVAKVKALINDAIEAKYWTCGGWVVRTDDLRALLSSDTTAALDAVKAEAARQALLDAALDVFDTGLPAECARYLEDRAARLDDGSGS